ncbi:ABC transporter substrate-binding protein [candidate division KSB1 bacterium]|nr:ABC transporter substrate-binding protein [candidate division KSB1 bacterium]
MTSQLRITSKHLTLILARLLVIFLFLNSCTKHKSEVLHVGILSGLNYLTEIGDGFKSKMTELGYIDGKNIIYDHQKTEFNTTHYKNVLNSFINNNVDLIFAFPTEASLEAKLATRGTNIPVIFAHTNVECSDLIQSTAKPGNNITGVRFPGPDIGLQSLEIMAELVPKAKRVWIPYQRNYPTVENQLNVMYPLARSMKIKLEEAPATDATELKSLLETHEKATDIGMDAILIIAEPLCVAPGAFEAMSLFAKKHKIPILGALVTIGDHGTLFGINVSQFATGEQAAILADKILKGTPAGSIPVVSAKPYFQLNYKLAQELGLKVSKGLLSKANEIIR